MNKNELLNELSDKINTGEISRQEVINFFSFSPSIENNALQTESLKKATSFSVTKMMYVLGAAIVVIGLFIFISQIWDDMGSLARITITLGLGLLITLVGLTLPKNKPEEKLGSVFYFIGGMLIPGGSLVTLNELSTGNDHPWAIAITFGIIFGYYLFLNSFYKNTVFTFFTIVNGTALVYLIIDAMIIKESYLFDDLYAYLTMVIGASYLLLAHSFREGWNRRLVGFLYFFGITGFLGAAFWQVFDSVFWQMLFFIIVISGLTLSVHMRSRSILVISTIFLIAHISYITSEYFTDSLGWPLVLIILGFIFIGLGYVSININKKLISN